jgi:SOS-response transcriptional repressor LexA
MTTISNHRVGQSPLRDHSKKTVSEDSWKHDHIELLPLNPEYDPILVAPHEGPEMVVVGEWVASID